MLVEFRLGGTGRPIVYLCKIEINCNPARPGGVLIGMNEQGRNETATSTLNTYYCRVCGAKARKSGGTAIIEKEIVLYNDAGEPHTKRVNVSVRTLGTWRCDQHGKVAVRRERKSNANQ